MIRPTPSHSYPTKKENRRIWPIKLRFICDLAAVTERNPSSSTSTTVSSPLGYHMCLAQFGMRHTQINNLPRGATVESPCWVYKTNILSFYLHSSLPSHGCLDVVVCSGTGPSYPDSGPDIMYQNSGFSFSGRNKMGFFRSASDTFDTWRTQTVKSMLCLFWADTL